MIYTKNLPKLDLFAEATATYVLDALKLAPCEYAFNVGLDTDVNVKLPEESLPHVHKAFIKAHHSDLVMASIDPRKPERQQKAVESIEELTILPYGRKSLVETFRLHEMQRFLSPTPDRINKTIKICDSLEKIEYGKIDPTLRKSCRHKNLLAAGHDLLLRKPIITSDLIIFWATCVVSCHSLFLLVNGEKSII